MEDRRHERQRNEALDEFNELDLQAGDLVTLLDRSLVLRGAIEQLTRVLGLDIAWVGEPRGNELLVCQITGERTDRIRGLILPEGRGLGGKVFALGRLEWVDEYFKSRTITHHFDEHVAAEGIHRAIAAPILHDNEVVAVLLGAARTDGTFGSHAARELENLASKAAVGLTVAERARAASQIAVHEERHRMALDLHDSVGAMMFAIGANVRELANELDAIPELRAKAALIERQAIDVTARLRESLQALHAPPEELAFKVALHADCRAFEERTRIPARLVMLGEVATLPPWRAKVLCQAVREALLNIEKHAKATTVVVTFGEAWDGIVVTVTDDGMGFADQDTGGGSGMGLQATDERLAQVGGRLMVDAHEEGGVTIRAWVPK